MGFNPNQARDKDGRFAGGVAGPAHQLAISALPIKVGAVTPVDAAGRAQAWDEFVKQKFGEGAKGEGVDPLGSANEPSGWRDNAKIPSVDWSGQDLQDSGKSVNEETIKRDYVAAKDRGDVDVYRSWVPMEDIPSPQLAEEMDKAEGDDEGGVSYPWEDFNPRNSFPPVKLEVAKDGKVSIVDGNHRLTYFERVGFTHAPAYVIDHRKNVKHDESED